MVGDGTKGVSATTVGGRSIVVAAVGVGWKTSRGSSPLPPAEPASGVDAGIRPNRMEVRDKSAGGAILVIVGSIPRLGDDASITDC